MKKKKKIESWFIIAGFFGILLLTGMGFLFRKEQEYSETEKRYLTVWKDVQKASFLQGELGENLENYLADQFPVRLSLVNLEGSIRILLQEKEIGGVYLGADGFLFEKITPSDVDMEQVKSNLQSASDFLEFAKSQEQIQTAKIMLVPSKGMVLEEKLPQGAPLYNQAECFALLEEMIGQENTVEVKKRFLADENPESLYYKTDHHWTLHGAYEAFLQYADSLGVAESDLPDEGEKRFWNTETETFRGTLYAKTLWNGCDYDAIVSYKNGNGYKVIADGECRDGLYADSALQTEDAYSYYLGGNASVLRISGDAQAKLSGRRLLVIKDSYANCFAPFAAELFEEIHYLDLRYYRGNISIYIKDNGITDVLVLYYMDGFVTDTNLELLPDKDIWEEGNENPPDEPSSEEETTKQPASEAEGISARELMNTILSKLSEQNAELYLDTVVSYSEELYSQHFSYLYGTDIEYALDGCISYASQGLKADEISIIKPADGNRFRIRQALLARIDRRIDDFRAYEPKEVEKLERARVFTVGDYVILVICDEPEVVEEICNQIDID